MADEHQDAAQNRGARREASAAGGVTARPGDPTSPAAAAARSAETTREMREAGFGDDGGASIDRPESPQPR